MDPRDKLPVLLVSLIDAVEVKVEVMIAKWKQNKGVRLRNDIQSDNTQSASAN